MQLVSEDMAEIAMEIKHEAADELLGNVALTIDAAIGQLLEAKSLLGHSGTNIQRANPQMVRMARSAADGIGQMVLEHLADNLPGDVEQLVSNADRDDALLDSEGVVNDVRTETQDIVRKIAQKI